MFTRVIFLILLSQFPNKITCSRSCTPNTQLFLNDRLCYCDSRGKWKDPHCYSAPVAGRRQSYSVGHVVIQGCTRCVCQEGGQYSCIHEGCATGQSAHEHLNALLPSCVPLSTYYLNCHICVCPATGRAADARCTFDVSCSFLKEPSASEISSQTTKCIPKVMYIFPCIRCMCSEQGHLTDKQCIFTCDKKRSNSTRRCIPKTLYRTGCNVCLCADNSIPGDMVCTNSTCSYPISYNNLTSLKNKQDLCKPHEFSKPKCVYCECNQDGGINEDTCLDLECLKHKDLKYNISRNSCSPGEMVPFCMECFCTRSGRIAYEYCSKACSYESKLRVLESLITSPTLNLIINKESIAKLSEKEFCNPASIYTDKDRICICPDSGFTNVSLCTASSTKIFNATGKIQLKINFNATCEPSTFVQFDCNSCFCSKKGKIDPKWCTYDDCEVKRSIQESHKVNPLFSNRESEMTETCNPGSIMNVDCNFCICPDSGLIEDRICTKNNCSSIKNQPLQDGYNVMCEPLAYFEVDCNICFCPGDGLKNLAKCTKNHCDKSSLRSDWCAPGQFFSSECSICMCPADGDPAGRACLHHGCSGAAPWATIVKLSQRLLGHRHQVNGDSTHNLDLCFPGEEFVVGCKVCVCPDVGLKMYADCSPSFCADGSDFPNNLEASEGDAQGSNRKSGPLYRKLETRREECMSVNVSDIYGRQKCTPGSMYIIRCKQCICPYAGSIAHYCRPLPEGYYCERAFPNVNFVPMARRNQDDADNVSLEARDMPTTTASSTATIDGTTAATEIRTLHEHTVYACDAAGDVKDDCFQCLCDNRTLIAEHCFQNTADYCLGVKPSFLDDSPPQYHTKLDENPLHNHTQLDNSPPHNHTKLDNSPPHNQTKLDNSQPHNQTKLDNSPPHNQTKVDNSPPHNQTKLDNTPPHNQTKLDNSPPHNQTKLDNSPPHNLSQLDNSPLLNHTKLDNSLPNNQTKLDNSLPHNQSKLDNSPLLNHTKLDNSPPHKHTKLYNSPPHNQTKHDNSPPHNQSKHDNSPLLNHTILDNSPPHNHTKLDNSPPHNQTKLDKSPPHNVTQLDDSPPHNVTQLGESPSQNNTTFGNKPLENHTTALT